MGGDGDRIARAAYCTDSEMDGTSVNTSPVGVRWASTWSLLAHTVYAPAPSANPDAPTVMSNMPPPDSSTSPPPASRLALKSHVALS